MAITPSVVTASTDYQLNYSSDTPAAFSQGSAPFRTSPTDLWIALASNPPILNTPLTMFHSTDNGLTWATEDALNGPTDSTSGANACYWDGARYLTAIERNTGGGFTLQLKRFDTVTKLWSAAFATGGPAADSLATAIFIRSDGKIAVLYVNFSGAPRNRMTLWNGAMWSAPTTYDDNTGGNGATSVATWIDSSDNIHVLMIHTTSVLLAYQRINSDTTLGPYIDLAANNLLFFDDAPRNATDSFSITLNPAQDTVVIGGKTAAYPTGKPALLTGSPLNSLSNPAAWNIGAALNAQDHSMYPQVYFDGTNPVVYNQWETVPASDEPDVQRLGTGSPTVWTDITSVIPPHLLFPVLRASATEALGAYGGWDGDGVNFFSFPIVPPPPAAPADIAYVDTRTAPIASLPDPSTICRPSNTLAKAPVKGSCQKRRRRY